MGTFFVYNQGQKESPLKPPVEALFWKGSDMRVTM